MKHIRILLDCGHRVEDEEESILVGDKTYCPGCFDRIEDEPINLADPEWYDEDTKERVR